MENWDARVGRAVGRAVARLGRWVAGGGCAHGVSVGDDETRRDGGRRCGGCRAQSIVQEARLGSGMWRLGGHEVQNKGRGGRVLEGGGWVGELPGGWANGRGQ